MKRQLEFEVVQGIIHVNSIRVLQSTSEVICFAADFRQKYAEGNCFQHDDNSVSFFASEDTIGVQDRDADPTIIRIKNIPKHWACIKSSVEVGRYSGQVILVKEETDLKKFKHWRNG